MLDREWIDRVVADVCAGNPGAIDSLVTWRASDVTLGFNPDPEDLTVEPLRFLRRYWGGLPRGVLAPLSSAVDPVAMRPALGYIVLIEIIDDGWNGRYRVFGSELTGPYGSELTGKTMVEGLPAQSLALHIAFLRILLRTAAPLYTHHCSPPTITVLDWRRLMLPLEGPDGAISRVLVASLPGPWRPPAVER